MSQLAGLQMELFTKKLAAGRETVSRILDLTRNPRMAEDVPHQYDDKFLLAEFLVASSGAASLTCLESLGLTTDMVKDLRNKSASGVSATLSLQSKSECSFVRKETREVEGPKHVTEVSGDVNYNKTTKTVTKVDHYFYNYKLSYRLVVYMGADPSNCVEVDARTLTTTIKTTTDTLPHPQHSTQDPVTVSLTWLLSVLTPDIKVSFKINKSSAECHTPSRNEDVQRALNFFEKLNQWCTHVQSKQTTWFQIDPSVNTFNTVALSTSDVFVPVFPLLEETSTEAVTLPAADIQAFLAEQRRSLTSKLTQIKKDFPDTGLISAHTISLSVLLLHLKDVCLAFEGGIDYVEKLLRDQLIAALGKEVTADDFGDYMNFHLRKLFDVGYETSVFSYAVRSGVHNPEGFFSIEQVKDEVSEPVNSIVAKISGNDKMKLPLSASSSVSFSGDVFAHSVVNYRFSTSVNSYNLTANARQFSGYVMLLGTIGSAELFLPKHALIIKNKDDLKIPLSLEEVPTPAQFKSSIESLSPEQQRFAKAYRSMQLEATLFGICIVQIKPQLERVLNLPPDSLTKEIKLSQDLMDMFLTYQIPSDLLSFQHDGCDDPDDIPTQTKVDQVRSHTAAMKEIISATKGEEVEEEKQKAMSAQFGMAQMHPCLAPAPVDFFMPQPQHVPPSTNPFAAAAAPATAWSSDGGVPFGGGGFGGGGGGAAFGGGGGGGGGVGELFGCSGGGGFSNHTTGGGGTGFSFGGASHTPPPVASSLSFRSSEIVPATQNTTAALQPSLQNDMVTQKPAPSQLTRDISTLPTIMESRFEALDTDDCLRPTIIKTSNDWTKKSTQGLLGKTSTKVLGKNEQNEEKQKALDLLDALTRSGAIEIPDAELHVVIASTHCFAKNVIDTVIQGNVNPIEKMERSILIAAAAIHDKPTAQIIAPDHQARVAAHSPQLFQ